jgi:hypothetical protein
VDLKTVHKDLLRPGTYTLPNRVKWTCTPADVRNACVIGNRMLHHADALSPPLIWEHDWNAEAIPLRVLLSAMAGDERREFAAGFAKNVFGHASRYYLRDERGQPALWAEARIKADAAPRFEVARRASITTTGPGTEPTGRARRFTTSRPHLGPSSFRNCR